MVCFTRKELLAIFKAADLMVRADGVILPQELVTVEEAMSKVGIKSPSEYTNYKVDAQKMSEEECFGVLAFLDFNQKKFVSSMLGTISSSDGDIDDRELELWRDICNKCDLPVMSNRQAISIFQTY